MQWYLKALKSYSDLKGRARRKEYWMYVLFNVGIVFLLPFLLTLLGLPERLVSGILLVYMLATFLPSLAVAVRRMHDCGKSGWLLLIPLVPIVWLLQGGDAHDNEYGPDPKGIAG